MQRIKTTGRCAESPTGMAVMEILLTEEKGSALLCAGRRFELAIVVMVASIPLAASSVCSGGKQGAKFSFCGAESVRSALVDISCL